LCGSQAAAPTDRTEASMLRQRLRRSARTEGIRKSQEVKGDSEVWIRGESQRQFTPLDKT